MIELVRTKLFIPRPRKNLVPRPRLIDCLNGGLDKKLTLIAAPVGFGKTTVLSEWIPQSHRCVTWLSLDEADNDPAKFWAYFIVSLQALRPDLGESSLDLLQSLQTSQITSNLTAMINDIAAFPAAFAIVLDDYHAIESAAIHETLAFLVDHLPANMHLVITTRLDPPLPLARLRARDMLTEIRASDLRFTEEESALFLKQVMGLNLSADEIAALETRTEGWIAGLQIAALSMQGRDNLSGFIQSFSGSHRHILGYLADEALNQQTPDTLNFLLQTSILGRLCGSLCDAVTGGSDGQAILEHLEHANLFIIPLDDEGVWYRYHHLFAEVLQARLQKSQPEMPAGLHQRASEWYEKHDSVAEAIHHALAAGAVDRVASLIELHRWSLLGRGETHTLRRWLNELPVDSYRNHPGLSLAYAWVLSVLLQPDSIELHLQDAERALAVADSKKTETSDKDAIRGEIAILRAELALSQLDVTGAISLCRQALKLLPEENKMMRGLATYFLGQGERRMGQMMEAELAYAEASRLGLETDNLLLALYALVNLTSVQIALGRLQEAARTSQRILDVTDERKCQTWPVAGLAYQGLGRLYYEWNDLETAARYSRLGIEHGQRGGLTGLEINSRSLLASTLQAQHDSNGADEMLQEIARINERNHHPVYATEAAAWEARLRLRQGRVEQAIAWARACDLTLEDQDLPHSREEEYLTLARACIALGELDGVAAMLDRLQQSAARDGRRGDAIKIAIQQALYLFASNNNIQAISLLERTLMAAEPEGFVRSFVDEGKSMHLLLLECRSMLKAKLGNDPDGGSLRLLKYVDRLLAAFSDSSPITNPRQDTLLEPLSERELDILRLIATGHSNQEIADMLVIAVSTVKSHINNLYGKLGANRRTQAIAIARDLGLLSE